SLWKATGDCFLGVPTAPGPQPNSTAGALEAWRFADDTRQWTRLATVLTDRLGELATASMMVDQNSGALYLPYLRGPRSRGANVTQLALGAYYQISLDGGLTWSGEIRMSSSDNDDDFLALRGNLTSADRLYATWFNDDLNNLRGATLADPVNSGGHVGLIYNLGPATGITANAAWVTGALTATGGLPTTVSLFWGQHDNGRTAAGWDFTNTLGPVGVGTFSLPLTNLPPATIFYYRFSSSNAAGRLWAIPATDFRTDGPPIVDNAAGASNIKPHGATLNGTLHYGNPATDIHVYWGDTDGGSTFSAWSHTNHFGVKLPQNLSTNLNSMLPGTIMYYRYFATNAIGGTWAPSSSSFETRPVRSGGITIEPLTSDASAQYASSPNVVFISDLVGYVFYVDNIAAVSTGEAVYRKTTDGGYTWSDPIALNWADGIGSMAVWYDRWTPGDDSGTRIHIAHIGSISDDLAYTYLDTANDTSADWVTVRNGNVWTALSDAGSAITRSTTGRLYVYAGGDFPTDTAIMSYSDDGTNWIESLTDPPDSAGADYGQLLPLPDGSIMLIQQDVSAEMLMSRIWNGFPWSPATNHTRWVDYTSIDSLWSASLDRDTGDVYLLGHTAPQPSTLTGDLEAYKYTFATGTWSTQGTVVDDTMGRVIGGTMLRDSGSGDLYAVYLRGSIEYYMSVYFRRSSDDGVTWSAESSRLNDVADDIKVLRGNLLNDERLYAVWFDDDNDKLYGTTVADLRIGLPTSPPLAVSNAGGATEIGATTARLRGHVVGANPDATVTLYYGPGDGLTNPAAWANLAPIGTVIASDGTFAADVAGLSTASNYVYRAYATNALGDAWAPFSVAFNTLAGNAVIDDVISNPPEYQFNTTPTVVFVDDQVGYVFHLDSDLGFYCHKTTDGGQTWPETLDMFRNQSHANIGVWYDRWTPGQTGSKIHIIYIGATDDDLYYNQLDVATDQLGDWRLVKDGDVFGAGVDANASITRASSGELFASAGAQFDGVDQMIVARSWDEGLTWTNIAGIADDLADGDRAQLLPLPAGDVLMIHQDISLDIVRSRVWDAGLNQWLPWAFIDAWLDHASYDASWGAVV
ncbi:MAG: sialidase family protein, partial [Verrucomicrobia bacterium]|nr:sialidase family protein [Verrucomicrobiota bacterium]